MVSLSHIRISYHFVANVPEWGLRYKESQNGLKNQRNMITIDKDGGMYMRRMEFKMERPGLLKEGDEITVTEGLLPSNYYYTIDPSLAMSGNVPFRERMLARKGRVISVVQNERGFYVTAEFDEA